MFSARFSTVTEQEIAGLLRTYCGFQRAGPLGAGEILLRDDNGELHIFEAETFCMKYHALTLARYVRPQKTQVAVAPKIAING
jgi:hypothetical protein